MSERFERAPQPIQSEPPSDNADNTSFPTAGTSPDALESSGLSRREFLKNSAITVGFGLGMSPDSSKAQTPDSERLDDGFMASEILLILFGPEALVGNTARRLEKDLGSKHPISIYADKMTEETEKQRDAMIDTIKRLRTKKEARMAAQAFHDQYKKDFVPLNKFGIPDKQVVTEFTTIALRREAEQSCTAAYKTCSVYKLNVKQLEANKLPSSKSWELAEKELQEAHAEAAKNIVKSLEGFPIKKDDIEKAVDAKLGLYESNASFQRKKAASLGK